jgi:hypothetical protein
LLSVLYSEEMKSSPSEADRFDKMASDIELLCVCVCVCLLYPTADLTDKKHRYYESCVEVIPVCTAATFRIVFVIMLVNFMLFAIRKRSK